MPDESQMNDPELASAKADRIPIDMEAQKRLLDAETEINQARIRELNHRIFLKNAGLAVSILVILAMLGLIGAMARIAIWEPNSPIFDKTAPMIVFVGAPITCIMMIIVAFLVGVFRTVDQKDIQAIGGGISDAAIKAYGGD